MVIAREQSNVSKNMLVIMAISVVPFLIIFIYFQLNPAATIFEVVANLTKNIPANYSSKNFLLSKTMDVYSKTAPIFALYFIISNYKSLTLRLQGKDASQVVVLLIMGTLLYITGFYLYFLSEHDLSTLGRLLRFMTTNDFTLGIYYIIGFAGMYSITVVYLWVILKVYPSYKQLADK